ncbi:MAG TPA: hypothetical protein VMA72_19460 [Streptosporangiaceae bacterium]|nr:hypothetical protein [Streptosporangiaceae bacterium]
MTVAASSTGQRGEARSGALLEQPGQAAEAGLDDPSRVNLICARLHELHGALEGLVGPHVSGGEPVEDHAAQHGARRCGG